MTVHHGLRAAAGNTGGGGGTYEYGWSSTYSPNQWSAVPFNVYYRRRRMQQIILASDLTAAGVPTGATFNDFTWHQVGAINSSYSILGFNFRMFHTNQSDGSVVATPITGTTSQTCYSDATNVEFTLAETTGDKTLTFTNGFTWNGTDNICMDTCATQCQTWYHASGQMRCVANVTNGMRYHHSDSSGSSCGYTPNIIAGYKYSFKMAYS